MALDLTLGGSEYDLTAPLVTQQVEPQGMDLYSVTYPSVARHWQMLHHQEFDVCELSLSSYLLSRANVDEHSFTLISVFPHRLFRHSYVFKHLRRWRGEGVIPHYYEFDELFLRYDTRRRVTK